MRPSVLANLAQRSARIDSRSSPAFIRLSTTAALSLTPNFEAAFRPSAVPIVLGF